MKYSHHVPAALRTLRLLELLAAAPEGLTAGQLAEGLGIPHSALHALLNTLMSQEYVAQAEPRQPYYLGPRAQALSRPRLSGADALLLAFYEEAHAALPEETLALATLSGRDMLILAEVPCTQTVRSVVSPGQREPAGSHPAGHVLLAGLSEPALERLAGPDYPAMCSELQTVRRQTLAQTSGKETMIIAVPICPDGQHPEAALMTSIPAFRGDDAKAARLTHTLHEMAARISYRLGALTYLPYGTTRSPSLGHGVPITVDELAAFLGGPWAAWLACLRPDGSPHIVTVWYEWAERAFWVTAWPGSRWAEWIIQNPSVALTVAEPWTPMRRVVARGQARHLSPGAVAGGPEALYRRISARYLGVAASVAAPVSPGTGWQAFCISPDEMQAQKEGLED
ncbi:MAG: helix-turn-helix domain-containing protein [Anaerolineae bacterium]|nr:helix-turn-helix domain-containing protein [Anaerolineae bacterium]